MGLNELSLNPLIRVFVMFEHNFEHESHPYYNWEIITKKEQHNLYRDILLLALAIFRFFSLNSK